jgi:hypothetical protein
MFKFYDPLSSRKAFFEFLCAFVFKIKTLYV